MKFNLGVQLLKRNLQMDDISYDTKPPDFQDRPPPASVQNTGN